MIYSTEKEQLGYKYKGIDVGIVIGSDLLYQTKTLVSWSRMSPLPLSSDIDTNEEDVSEVLIIEESLERLKELNVINV
jgi:hypothetical protein